MLSAGAQRHGQRMIETHGLTKQSTHPNEGARNLLLRRADKAMNHAKQQRFTCTHEVSGHA